MLTQADLDRYSTLTAPEQAALRTKVYEDLTAMSVNLDAVHARANQIRDNLAALATFVGANSADFGGTADLITARNRVRQQVASHANGWQGISGATVA